MHPAHTSHAFFAVAFRSNPALSRGVNGAVALIHYGANPMSTVLPDLAAMSREQLEAMVKAMAAAPSSRLTMKVSEKGALCLYGLGRFPVTLYASQWRRLIDPKQIEAISAFLKANAATLTEKA